MSLMIPPSIFTQYKTRAVDFDASNDYLSRGAELTGLVDGKAFTLSVWARTNGGDGSVLTLFRNDGGFLDVDRFSDNKFRVRAFNSSSSGILSITTTNTYVSGATAWNHLLVSVDLAATTALLYVNGTNVLAGGGTVTNDTIDFTRANWYIGATQTPGQFWNGDMADLFFTPSFIDISTRANRERFRRSTKPADLGPQGAQPTGARPLVYLRGPASAFATNLGTGGNFTVNGGGLADASTSPTD